MILEHSPLSLSRKAGPVRVSHISLNQYGNSSLYALLMCLAFRSKRAQLRVFYKKPMSEVFTLIDVSITSG